MNNQTILLKAYVLCEWNYVLQLFKERVQSLKHIVAAKKYLKYLTSLCDSIAMDPDCNKPAEELAAEIFDLKEIVNSEIVVTKQTSLLPTLSFRSCDEDSNSEQQRDGKSESEAQPLIFLPIVPARSTSEELGEIFQILFKALF